MRYQKSKAYLAAFIVSVCIMPIVVWAFASNPPLNSSGAPGESTCANCHSGGAQAGHVAITVAGGNTYTPGAAKQVTVTITDPNAKTWGYEITSVEASSTSTGVGTFTALDANSSVRSSGTKSYAAQVNDAASTYQLSWMPPASSVGNITLYVSSVGGTSSGPSGDSVYNSSLTLTPAVTTSPSLSLSPSTLSFSATVGGTAPAAKTIAVASSTSTALSYTVSTTTSATWLSATPASGSTPGTISVSVNPAGLTAGTYTGSVTIASSGASNSPQTVAVTFTVGATSQPSLTLSPASLSFAATTGGTAPAAQDIAVSSSSSALSYTVSTTSSATWLSATPASGTSPGTVRVAVNPAGLAAGTYNASVSVASTGAANTPQTVPVTLTVSSAGGGGTLSTMPRYLRFTGLLNGNKPHPQSLHVAGTAHSFTAKEYGATWLTVTPAAGATPGTVTVSVDTADLVPGHYAAVIEVSAPGATNTYVPVMLTVQTGSGTGGGGGETEDSAFMAAAYTYDPDNTGGVAAQWVSGAGVPSNNPKDPTNQGLLLTNNVPASSKARAGVLITNVQGINLTALGFDVRQASLCTAQGPYFIVQTQDGVNHVVGGCNTRNIQPAPAAGWTRFRFNPAHASPPIGAEETVKSISLMMDQGPDKNSGHAVLDNININDKFIGHE
jgi:Viral BACON domain